MKKCPPKFRFYKFGPLKNQLLVYALAGALVLNFISRDADEPVRSALKWAAIVIVCSGPCFWLYAYTRLPTSAQERAFLESTIENVQHDRDVREKK